jgi:gas vesicle protein
MTVRHGAHRGSLGVLVFGGLVGAGVALMAAPWSGRETRRKIGDFAEDVKERAECYACLAKGKATSAIEHGREFLHGKKRSITTAIEAGKDAYKREKERLSGVC